MSNSPLVVAVLHADAEDKRYQLYSAAYGLEMQIDDEWDVELVLLAPHEHLTAVTEETGVTGEDTVYVSAGVIDVPMIGGKPDLSSIADERNNWLLVAAPKQGDSEETIRAKLAGALGSGRRAILCFTEVGTNQLPSRLAPVGTKDMDRLVVAYVGPNSAKTSYAPQVVQFFRECLKAKGSSTGGVRLIVGGAVNPKVALAMTAVDGIAGVFLSEDSYSDFSTPLKILSELGESDD